ncbi:MAG: methionyl-tRNA formyltransferase [Cyanobium sp.]
MKILFWGTPAYALASLDALVAAGHELVGVVSQPDRRRGRGSTLMPSAVKARALELGLRVFTPQRIRRDPAMQAELAALGADAYVVVAFGQILPPEVLAQPPLGCWNGHGSLLPRWRGAAPIQWALIEGDPYTGVGIMAMEEGLDTGPVLLERRVQIDLLDNAEQLALRLASLTGDLLIEALPRIEAAGPGSQVECLSRLNLAPQSQEGVTHARLLTPQDRRIDWQSSALSLHRQVMGLYPGAWTQWRQRRLQLLATEPLVQRLAEQLSPEAAAAAGRWAQPPAGTASGREAAASGRGQPTPGQVLDLIEGVGLVVATGGCPLLIRSAKLEGRAAAAGTSLIQQCAAAIGDRLGEPSAQDRSLT